MQRMISLQLEEAKLAANIDAKDGLETIDLSAEPEPTLADVHNSPPEAFFRKTQPNNFFAVDESPT